MFRRVVTELRTKRCHPALRPVLFLSIRTGQVSMQKWYFPPIRTSDHYCFWTDNTGERFWMDGNKKITFLKKREMQRIYRHWSKTQKQGIWKPGEAWVPPVPVSQGPGGEGGGWPTPPPPNSHPSQVRLECPVRSGPEAHEVSPGSRSWDPALMWQSLQ